MYQIVLIRRISVFVCRFTERFRDMFDFFILISNPLINVAVVSWWAAQILKTSIHLFKHGEFKKERLSGAGGMPSSHSATVCAMVVATGRYCGVNSPIFAIAAELSIIVMYDAMGVRYETGEQAKVLNRMFTEWMDQGFEQFQLPHGKKLKEMVGHTPIEVVTGAALGIVLGFAMPMV